MNDNTAEYEGLDKALWDRFDEARKVLRSVKSCNKMFWGAPSANQVRLRASCVLYNILISQVYEGLFIGNREAALSVSYLSSLGITHLLNCAHPGPKEAMSVDVSEEELRLANIQYLGLQLADESYQEISPVFERSGDWINAALSSPGNKVLVNCWAGISRSATVSLAFLVRRGGERGVY